MRRGAPARGLALTTALALTLTACSGGGEQEPEETSPPSTTAPASATTGTTAEGPGDGEYVPASAEGPARNVPEPVMPEEMKEQTPEGAKAAVQYWWDTVTYLQRTGDAAPLQAVSDEECDFCRTYTRSIEKIYEDGGWTSGSDVEVASALTGVIDRDLQLLQVTTLLDVGGITTFTSNGSIDRAQSEESYGDSPWVTNVRFDDESKRWVATYVSFEGEQ